LTSPPSCYQWPITLFRRQLSWKWKNQRVKRDWSKGICRGPRGRFLGLEDCPSRFPFQLVFICFIPWHRTLRVTLQRGRLLLSGCTLCGPTNWSLPDLRWPARYRHGLYSSATLWSRSSSKWYLNIHVRFGVQFLPQRKNNPYQDALCTILWSVSAYNFVMFVTEEFSSV
jgi:hypothetical protein